ncbi:MAG TPA: prenyltransferase/squalene oxidase repeat-containing protein [Mycobacteriales bacterium]|nr:prenyltransferase/squalene oxidase repeat-containing protein [Mycobacteriales bacterium]
MTGADDRLDEAIQRTVSLLRRTRRLDGSWVDELPSAAVATGAAVTALAVATATASADLVAGGAAWLRRTQNDDGGWGDAPGAPTTLNATAISVAALRVADPKAHAHPVARGIAAIEGLGGGEALRDRARCSLSLVCRQLLALAGAWDETQIHRLPFELVLLPGGLRKKLSFTVPGLMAWGVMQAHTRPAGPARQVVNRWAERGALRYLDTIRRYQGPAGGIEESPLMVSVVLIGLARAGVEPAAVREQVAYLHRTVRPDGSWAVTRDLDHFATALATLALTEARGADDAWLSSTLAWVERARRDLPFPPTGCPAGGWGWALPSGWPDTDDTAYAVTALAQRGRRGSAAVAGGVAWLRAMQNSNGSWSCFTRNARISLDAPCVVLTAHAVAALRAAGAEPADESLARAQRWLARVQHADGSYDAIWYRPGTSGTAAALETFALLGAAGTEPACRARGRLVQSQLADGGWNSGRDDGPATAEETAWALLALLAAGVRADDPTADRAARWLLAAQRRDGRWAPSRVGIYYLDLTYSDDMFSTAYALAALARYRDAQPRSRQSATGTATRLSV